MDRRSRAAGIGSFIVDPQGTLVGFDQGMETLTGWLAAEVVGRHRKLPEVDAGGRATGLAGPLWEGPLASDLGSRRISLKLRCKDGRVAEVEAAVTREDPASPIHLSVLRIVALSGGSSQRGEPRGVDRLTGLLDRQAFLWQIESKLAWASEVAVPVALIVADLDHFRWFNDRWGRQQGDEVLRKLAGILRAEVPDEDLIGRLDDDGIGVLLPGAGRGEARVVAARVRSLIERIREVKDGEGPLTASLGAASYPADAERPEELVARSLEALNEARRLGRNRVWCYQRRPRVPVRTPVYFDAEVPLLLGYTADLSPSGFFVRTRVPIEVGMRCALAFPLPDLEGRVHVIGRVVRTVPEPAAEEDPPRMAAPGMGVEFERFSPEDRQAIEIFLYAHEGATLRPENGRLSL